MCKRAQEQGKPTAIHLWMSSEVSGTQGLPNLGVAFGQLYLIVFIDLPSVNTPKRFWNSFRFLASSTFSTFSSTI